MIATHDVQTAIAKLDEEIIRLLAERVSLFREAQEEDPDSLTPEHQSEVVAQWDEAADEHGWSPAMTAKLCRAVTDLCKQVE
jgi:chorismate mutase